jgi:hypothetical protein
MNAGIIMLFAIKYSPLSTLEYSADDLQTHFFLAILHK